MCGFVSVFDPSKSISDDVITQLVNTLSHRGPDDSGTKVYSLVNNNVGLGHRRLSILDLSREGHQPMSFLHYDIVFNGEIYNFLDLKQKLIQHGYTFTSSTDTEVFLKAFDAWGKCCFSMFNGMFSVSIYNRISNELTICRDRFGIKPLYYFNSGGFFAFASEIEPLKSFLAFPISPNTQFLPEYLKYRFLEGNSTFVSDIYEFPKSEIWTVSNNLFLQESIDDYISDVVIHNKKVSITQSSPSTIDLLERLLLDSLEQQIYADVPVGFFLSGGLDSSLLVSMATKAFGKVFDTYSVSFANYEYSEAYYQQLVVRDCGSHHHNFLSTHENYYADYVFTQSKASSPHFIANYTQIYQLARLAKSNVKVLLSGEGADEIFGGYGRFLLAKRIQVIQNLHLNNVVKAFSFFSSKFNQYLSHGAPSWHYFTNMSCLADEDISNILNSFSPLSPRSISSTNLNCLLQYDQDVYMRGLLNRADSMSMLAGIEVRVPYINPLIIDFANKMSFDSKVSVFHTKILLAQLAKKYIPNEIINRSKIGFPIPLSNWMCQDIGLGKLKYILCDERSIERGLYNHTRLTEIFSDPFLIEHYAQNLIFPLLSFELWVRTFLEDTPYDSFSFS